MIPEAIGLGAKNFRAIIISLCRFALMFSVRVDAVKGGGASAAPQNVIQGLNIYLTINVLMNISVTFEFAKLFLYQLGEMNVKLFYCMFCNTQDLISAIIIMIVLCSYVNCDSNVFI